MKKNVPKHIAIIMDGNRRWAKQHRLAEIWGHRQGVETLVEVVEEADSLGVDYVTVYTLSSENFQNRPKKEIGELLKLIGEGISKHLPRLKKYGVRLEFIGDLGKLPVSTQLLAAKAKKDLSGGKNGSLIVALNYGGRQEIIQAASRLSKKNLLFIEKNFTEELFTSGIPDPELLIRTGGEKRLSNFLLWQLSYAELYFTDTLCPKNRTQISQTQILPHRLGKHLHP